MGLRLQRVVVASELRIYREAVTVGLEASGTLTVVGVADDADLARAVVQVKRPDMLLLDLTIAHSRPLVEHLLIQEPGLCVIAMAVRETEEVVLACVEAGITSYIPQAADLNDAISIVQAAARGEATCSPRIITGLFRRLAALAGDEAEAHAAVRLTQRETQVLALIDEGLSNKEIADALFIGLPTVKHHVHNLLEKLQVTRRADAVTQARRLAVAGTLLTREGGSFARALRQGRISAGSLC